MTLIRFGGSPVSATELHRRFDEAPAAGTYVDTIAIGVDRHRVLPAGSIAHYANHRCDPTMWLGAALELVARVDLPPGAALTSDCSVMSDDPAFEMTCRCGAAGCRGGCQGATAGSSSCRTSTKAAGGQAWRLASTPRERPHRTTSLGSTARPRSPVHRSLHQTRGSSFSSSRVHVRRRASVTGAVRSGVHQLTRRSVDPPSQRHATVLASGHALPGLQMASGVELLLRREEHPGAKRRPKARRDPQE